MDERKPNSIRGMMAIFWSAVDCGTIVAFIRMIAEFCVEVSMLLTMIMRESWVIGSMARSVATISISSLAWIVRTVSSVSIRLVIRIMASSAISISIMVRIMWSMVMIRPVRLMIMRLV